MSARETSSAFKSSAESIKRARLIVDGKAHVLPEYQATHGPTRRNDAHLVLNTEQLTKGELEALEQAGLA